MGHLVAYDGFTSNSFIMDLERTPAFQIYGSYWSNILTFLDAEPPFFFFFIVNPSDSFNGFLCSLGRKLRGSEEKRRNLGILHLLYSSRSLGFTTSFHSRGKDSNPFIITFSQNSLIKSYFTVFFCRILVFDLPGYVSFL